MYTTEEEAAFDVPAPLVNRFQLIVSATGARLCFLEETNLRTRTVPRSAVSMSIADLTALRDLITEMTTPKSP